jgi:hypothetical protein
MHMKDRAFSPGIAFISSVIFSRVFFFCEFSRVFLISW